MKGVQSFTSGYSLSVNEEPAKVGKRKPGAPQIKLLSELPSKCWQEGPQDKSGIQYFTKGRVGVSTHGFMLDGGSAVNSTTEELIVGILNEHSAAGIKVSDKKHPIKALEKWSHEKALRGVA